MNDLSRKLVPGQIYRHFKGKLYQIITVAIHSETGEKLVIYQKLYDDFRVHARPYDMFLSEVDHVKYPDVRQKYRFELVSDTFTKQQSTETESIQDETDTIKVMDTDNKITELKEDTAVYSRNISENKAEFIDNSSESDQFTDGEPDTEEEQADPLLLKFLDADTFEEKRNILISIKDKITDQLIDNIAASMDVTVDEGNIDKRFSSLLACVDTRSKFEINRFR